MLLNELIFCNLACGDNNMNEVEVGEKFYSPGKSKSILGILSECTLDGTNTIGNIIPVSTGIFS